MAHIKIELSEELTKSLGDLNDAEIDLIADNVILKQYYTKEGTVMFGLVGYKVNGSPSKDARRLLQSFEDVAGLMASDLSSQVRNWSSPRLAEAPDPTPPSPDSLNEEAAHYKLDPMAFETHRARSDGQPGVHIDKIKHIEYYTGGTSLKKIFFDTVLFRDDPLITEEVFTDPETLKTETHKVIVLEIDPTRNSGNRFKTVKLIPIE